MGIMLPYLYPLDPHYHTEVPEKMEKGEEHVRRLNQPQGGAREPRAHVDCNSTDHSRGRAATPALRALGSDFCCDLCPTSLPFFTHQTLFPLKPQCFFLQEAFLAIRGENNLLFLSVCFPQHSVITHIDSSPLDKNDVPGCLGQAGRGQAGLKKSRCMSGGRGLGWEPILEAAGHED